MIVKARPDEVARDLSMALWRIYNLDRTGNGSQSAEPFNPLTSFYTASAGKCIGDNVHELQLDEFFLILIDFHECKMIKCWRMMSAYYCVFENLEALYATHVIS